MFHNVAETCCRFSGKKKQHFQGAVSHFEQIMSYGHTLGQTIIINNLTFCCKIIMPATFYVCVCVYMLLYVAAWDLHNDENHSGIQNKQKWVEKQRRAVRIQMVQWWRGRSGGGVVTYLGRSRRCVLYTVQCTDREWGWNAHRVHSLLPPFLPSKIQAERNDWQPAMLEFLWEDRVVLCFHVHIHTRSCK